MCSCGLSALTTTVLRSVLAFSVSRSSTRTAGLRLGDEGGRRIALCGTRLQRTSLGLPAAQLPFSTATFSQPSDFSIHQNRVAHIAEPIEYSTIRLSAPCGDGRTRLNPATRRLLVDEGDVDAALAAAAKPMPRTYVWPYQMHASIGPSCALAQWEPGGEDGFRLRVWAGSQSPHVLRADLAKLMGLDDVAVDVVRMEAAGCYGRNGADDVAADAALLARAVGAPVRVQLTREQEHAWEPKGAAQLMQVQGGLDADGHVAAYDFETSYPSNGAPTLALLLTRTIEPVAQAFEMGDRTARPPYAYGNLRVKVNDMAPIVRASWLRGVSALPSFFAHESYVDELATAAGVDPVAFRLRHLHDPRAADLVRETAQKAGWRMRTGPQENADGGLGPGGDILFGQGFAYARYVHSKWPGFGAAWSAWVADVEVNRKTGEVHVRRVVVGHDAGLMVNPAGVEHQIHGNVIQTTSRALKERVQFAPPSMPGGSRCRACGLRGWSRAANGAATRSSTSAKSRSSRSCTCNAPGTRRWARGSLRRCRERRRSQMRSSMRRGCVSGRRRSRRRWCARR